MTTRTAAQFDLGTLRILGCLRISLGYVWLSTVLHSRNPLEMPGSAWQPISLASWFVQRPGPLYCELVYVLAVVSAMCLSAGFLTRWTGPLCLVAGAMQMSLAMSFGKLAHGTTGLLLAMIPLAFSNWGDALSLDRLWQKRIKRYSVPRAVQYPAAPLWLAVLALALPYFSSAVHKISEGAFLAEGNMALFLKSRLILCEFSDADTLHPWAEGLVVWIIQRPGLSQSLAFFAVAVEGLFWLGLLNRKLRIAALGAAVSLHAGIAFFSNIQFRDHITLLCLLLASTLALAARDRWPSVQAWFPLPALADGPAVSGWVSVAQMICLATAAAGLVFAGQLLPDGSPFGWRHGIDVVLGRIVRPFPLPWRPILLLLGSGVAALAVFSLLGDAVRSLRDLKRRLPGNAAGGR